MSDKTKEQRAQDLQRLGDNIKAAFSSLGYSAEEAAKGISRFGAACKSKPELHNRP